MGGRDADQRAEIGIGRGDLAVDVGEEADGVVLNRHATPGTFVGEIGTLLAQRRSATVSASAPTVVREIGDPDGFFMAHPQLCLDVARQLAGRIFRLTAYVADVERQFGDRDDHLGMFGELLRRIADSPTVDIEPGSDRAPDY